MYRQVVLFFGIQYAHVTECASITYLTTHLCVEWSLGEYHLVEIFTLLVYLTITQNFGLTTENIVSYKLCVAFAEFYPVAQLLFVGLTTHFFLTLKSFVVLLFVGGETILAENQLSQVKWETVGIFQGEHIHTRNLFALSLFHEFIKQTDTLV